MIRETSRCGATSRRTGSAAQDLLSDPPLELDVEDVELLEELEEDFDEFEDALARESVR